MRASIVFIDDEGNKWEHELTLVARADRSEANKQPPKKRMTAARAPKSSASKPTRTSAPDFSLPIRPFIKRYARGVSGPKKFAILVARITKGEMKAEVPFSEIEKQWNKMKQLMGGSFNPAHASRAKDNGWVDSPKHGVYKLLGEWRDALPSD